MLFHMFQTSFILLALLSIYKSDALKLPSITQTDQLNGSSSRAEFSFNQNQQLTKLNILLGELAEPTDVNEDLNSYTNEGDLWYNSLRSNELKYLEMKENNHLNPLHNQENYKIPEHIVRINVREAQDIISPGEASSNLSIKFDKNFHSDLLPLLTDRTLNENQNKRNLKENYFSHKASNTISQFEKDATNYILKKRSEDNRIKLLKSKLMMKRYKTEVSEAKMAKRVQGIGVSPVSTIGKHNIKQEKRSESKQLNPRKSFNTRKLLFIDDTVNNITIEELNYDPKYIGASATENKILPLK